MRRRWTILAVAVWLAAGSAGWALDMVRTIEGRSPIPGDVASMTPFQVELKIGLGNRAVPVNEIISISFDSEPSLLANARSAVLEGRYEDALATLGKITLDDRARPEIKQDIEFYTALCQAELALAGNGEVVAAGKQMAAFVNKNKNNYHWLKANEVVGDLYLAVGAFEQAERYYAELGKAPWPDFQMRAGVAVGRARMAQGQTAQALSSFEGVLAIDAPGELAKSQRWAAMVGKAGCLAAEKKYDEAIELASDAIGRIGPGDVELLARAYNTQGAALKASGRLKEAMMAYLHVDAVYFAVPETHAEALRNLAELWEKLGKPERASQARLLLEQRYGGA